MAHSFRPYNPEQPFLLPPSPQDWLPEDHLAYHVLDVVSQLDMSAFYAGYSSDGRGAAPFSPIMMVSLLLYGWCRHVYSCRKLAALCLEDIGARVIVADNRPDHNSVNLFRLRHGEALSKLFKQSVDLCQKAGMVSLVHVAVDGSKIAASASKRKAMSYGRIDAEEARLQAEIDGYLRRAAEEDARDDATFGPDNSGPNIPDEIKRRQTRLVKLRAAKEALEAEAQAAAEAKRLEREVKEAASDKPLSGRKPNIDPTPKDKAQRCFTDPDSRIMKGGDGSFMQGYNGQAAVDGAHQVIVACDLSQDANDKRLLVPLVEQTVKNTGRKPKTVLTDPGFYSEKNIDAMDAMGISVLIPPDRERCGVPSDPAPELTAEEYAAMSAIARMRHKVSTKAGREAYRLRKSIVEPVFGQAKGCAGSPGFLGFLRRGLKKCTEEWHWLCARHNIMKYIRFQRAQKSEPPAPKRHRRPSLGLDSVTLQVPMAI